MAERGYRITICDIIDETTDWPRISPLSSSAFTSLAATALSPLSDEMRRLDRDLANTGHFLLASLP